MLKIYTAVLLTLTAIAVEAQSTKLDWAKQNKGIGESTVMDMALDTAGNIYLTGYFTDTVDFDPGLDTFLMVSAGNKDVFIQKLTPSGDLVWAKRMGGVGADQAQAIALDAAGNIYTVGTFTGTVDFNPAAATNNLVGNGGGVDVFAQKLTAAGNYSWAIRNGNVQIDNVKDVAVDSAGSVYITGSFIGTVDFNPAGATANLVSASTTFPDIYVQKLTTAGIYSWAKRVGGTDFDEAYRIALDATGNVFVTGYFSAFVDFDPNAGADTLYASPSRDVFILKLTSAGNYVWAKQFDGSIFNSTANDLKIDAKQNIYLAGYFSSTVDFDPGVDTLALTSAGGTDAFIVKLDSAGALSWARQLAGISSNQAISLAVDTEGSVYTTGYFANTVDFDPGIDASNLTSQGNATDIFVQKLDSLGELQWVRKVGSAGSDIGEAIIVDPTGNVYFAGSFTDTVDFDPQATTFELTTDSNFNGFVAKWIPCSPTYSSIDTAACYAFTSVSGNTYTSTGTYTEAFVNADGCDSLVTINLTIKDTARETITAVECGSYTLNAETYDTSGTYTQVFTSAAGCDSILTLLLTIKNKPEATVTQVDERLTATDTLAIYQWVNCSDYVPIANATRATYVATVSGDYAVIVTANGCSDTSACYNVIISGINEAFGLQFKLYPNPTTGKVAIDLGANYRELNVNVSTIAGQVVLQQQYSQTSQLELLIDAPAGIYFVTLTTADGLKGVIKLVKE
jgi:hypothetical protein